MEKHSKDLFCELCHWKFEKKADFVHHLKSNHRKNESNLNNISMQCNILNENLLPHQGSKSNTLLPNEEKEVFQCKRGQSGISL